MKKFKKQEKRPVYHDAYDHLDEAFTNACSPTECTGLIAHAPLTEEEYESYRDIYDFQPPYVAGENEKEGTGPAYGTDITADEISSAPEQTNNL